MTGIAYIQVFHRVARDHRARYGKRPIEMRMSEVTAERMGAELEQHFEVGFTLDDVKHITTPVRIHGTIVALDDSLPWEGMMLAWPTPDEWAATQAQSTYRRTVFFDPGGWVRFR